MERRIDGWMEGGKREEGRDGWMEGEMDAGWMNG